MASSRPTLADVARAAGVSVPTVSKAISGRTDVAEATRERVLGVMNELGYVSRSTSFAGQRPGTIELAIAGIESMWALEIVRGAEEAAARSGRALTVTNAQGDAFSAEQWIDSVLARKAAGVIIAVARVNGDLSRFTKAGVPVIFLGSGFAENNGFAQVGVTDWAGMRDAVRHMISLGHTRIGFISGRKDLAISQDRLDGYIAALRQGELPVDPELIVDGDFFVGGGERGARELLDLDDPPTAIVASSDLAAMGVYHVAHERGLSIPEDLSVTGFDDTILCEYLAPPLTTVRQPLAQMAEQAVRLLDDMARSAEGPQPRIELSTVLVERASTAAARAR